MLDIIVVNWNSGNLLLNCIISLINSDLNTDLYTINVIDNNSSDNSLSKIENLSPNINIVKSEINLGFGGACNLILEKISSKYVLFLNPDVVLKQDTLSKSIEFLDNNQEIEVLGVKNLTMDGKIAKSCARFPTPLRFIFDMVGLSKFAPKIFKPATIMSDWDHLESKKVDHVIGAYMLIRFQSLCKSGFFDKDYFLYLEDLDLSYRIKKNGGEIYYNSDIEIYHEGGGTTKNIKSTRLLYSMQSRIIYGKKHFNYFSVLMIILFSSLLEPFFRIVRLAITLNFLEIYAVCIAYSKYYKWLIVGK